MLEDFERFNQCNDIYSRAQWGERVRAKKANDWFKGLFLPGLGVKKTDGYGVKDFALRNAGWMGTNLVIQRSLDRTASTYSAISSGPIRHRTRRGSRCPMPPR